MKIAFFGSSLVSAYWNGAATYYRGIIRALHARGHSVTFYEPDAYDRQKHRDIEDPPWAKVRVWEPTEAGALRVLGEAAGADLVVKASGVGVLDGFLEEGVLSLQRPSTLVAYWDVDAPATLDRLAAHREDPFRRLVPRYDLILTYGGGRPVVDGYTRFGAQSCHPLYNALDPSTHHPVGKCESFAADLSLLANRLPDREDRIADFFFRAAENLPERKFLLGGNGWGDRSLPGNVRYVGHVYTADHNRFNASSLAVLNVSRESMARYGFSPATRVFEAAGAGACLITDRWEGIELFLEPGTEVLVAGDGADVAEVVAGLTPRRASDIGHAALKRVLAEHTYDHRAAEFERIFDAGPATLRAAG